MENKLPQTCYWCGTDVTGNSKIEHVPPKGFFPKDHRNNLMTVPSCKEHNNNFSALDEKFQFYLKAHKSNNVARADFFDKVLRGLKRKEKEKFVNALNNNSGFGAINGRKYLFTKLEPHEPDLFIEKIIRGLYFYHQEKPARGMVKWVSKFIHFVGIDSIAGVDFLKEGLNDSVLKDGDYNNPEVFQYQYMVAKDTFCLIMNFYEGVEFIAWVFPEEFSFENFNPADYACSEDQLQAINNINEIIHPIFLNIENVHGLYSSIMKIKYNN